MFANPNVELTWSKRCPRPPGTWDSRSDFPLVKDELLSWGTDCCPGLDGVVELELWDVYRDHVFGAI